MNARSILISFTHAVNAVIGSSAYQLAVWARDDIKSLSLSEKYDRIVAITNYLEQSAAHLETYGEKHDYLSQRFSKYIDLARDYYQSINYSRTLRENFREIAKNVADDIYEFDQTRNASAQFRKMNLSAKRRLAQEISNIYFENAKKTLEDLHPSLEKVPIRAEPSETSNGWVWMGMEGIQKGLTGSIYLGDKYLNETGFLEFVNTICHEATHHSMIQFASMAERGLIDVPEAYETDIATILMTAEKGAAIPSYIYPVYRSNPFERIAHRTGDAVETFLSLNYKTGGARIDPCIESNLNMVLDRMAREEAKANHIMLKAHMDTVPSLKAV